MPIRTEARWGEILKLWSSVRNWSAKRLECPYNYKSVPIRRIARCSQESSILTQFSPVNNSIQWSIVNDFPSVSWLLPIFLFCTCSFRMLLHLFAISTGCRFQVLSFRNDSYPWYLTLAPCSSFAIDCPSVYARHCDDHHNLVHLPRLISPQPCLLDIWIIFKCFEFSTLTFHWHRKCSGRKGTGLWKTFR